MPKSCSCPTGRNSTTNAPAVTIQINHFQAAIIAFHSNGKEFYSQIILLKSYRILAITFAIFQRCEVILADEFYKSFK
ncbi:CBM_collapsed_G0025680.mRNA.1.CDS.1 [Saccharomyces cerevisiae]|nr:CBM_collapsed_G0025680.mRNA.1.CDS.1 [Saccharomyces cerevisiae]